MRWREIGIIIATILCALSLSGCMEAMAVQAVGSNLSAGTQVDDMTLQARAQYAVFEMDLPEESHVDLTAFNGMLLVLGQVPTRAIRADITSTLREVPDAKVIYNRLSIGPGNNLIDVAEDGMVSANVKAVLLNTVNPLHFKVVTENSVVYLMGYTTPQEGQLALIAAQNAVGVKKVIPIFTYVKPQRAKISYLGGRP